ncbi:MAG: type IX secretion system sortase PorU [Bacteroidales bacterium]|nr:type IX secretion system sortase PorU [Bacteroidales bacterium]
MKKIILLFCCLFALSYSQAQEMVQIKIKYTNVLSLTAPSGQTIHYYSFSGATNKPEFGALPLLFNELKLPDAVFDCDPQLQNVEEETIAPVEIALLNDLELCKSNYQIISEKLGDQALVYVLPFRHDSATDSFLRLTSATLKLTLFPADPKKTVARQTVEYTNQSVLSNGTWYKIGTVERGIYRLDYAFFESLGVNPSQLDPDKIGIFGNYNGMLPEMNYTARVDDLEENAIERVGMEDGVFNTQDYILFYGESPTTYHYNSFARIYNHEENLYTDTISYFLTLDQGSGLNISTLSSTTTTPDLVVNDFLEAQSHETDKESLLYSGKLWFGEDFIGDSNVRHFSFNFPHMVTDFPVNLKIQMVARAMVYTYFDVSVNGETAIDSTLFLKVSPSSHAYATKATKSNSFFVNNDQLDVAIHYYSEDPNSTAWLDYIEINARRQLIYTGGQMIFREPDAAQSGQIVRFNIRNVNSPVKIWAITENHQPKGIQFQNISDTLQFTLNDAGQRDFIIFDENNYLVPAEVLPVSNQNLHNIDQVNMVIVAPTLFAEQAQRISDLHRNMDGLTSIIVTPDQIYNEFSSGSQDVSAIRDFMKMLYNKGSFGEKPGYLLLFGDASFDYKHRIAENTNIVPTYESLESLTETGSFVTDDYFGLLDEYEGGSASGELDLGIGRFPVSTAQQAWNAVNKVENYMLNKPAVSGNWRNTICFVADDQDSNLHLDQAEGMASIADTAQSGIRVNKIYSDAYAIKKTSAGYRYPDVNVNINNQVEEGATIINYTGHGGLIGWSEEQILNVPAINGYKNINNLPLFITATCEFSRFDNPQFTSAGEYAYLNPDGGAIALLTTTRLAYAHANIVVNTRIYQHLFQKENGEFPRLGDLVRLSKTPSSTNYLNFALLGDPALRLSFPHYQVITNTINDVKVSESVDTAMALSEITINGSIVDDQGNLLNNFNGFVYPTVYDKKAKYTTLGNMGSSSPENFYLYDRVLFKGKSTVVNGVFSFTFIIPKDIVYSFGYGQISYYALDSVTFDDAWGQYDKLLVGGYNQNAVVDLEGPQIEAYLNNSGFKSGDVVTSKAVLYARIFDQSGINFTSSGLGRDIIMTVDNDYKNSVQLNSHFNIDQNSYQQGMINYQFENLTPGMHTVVIKAWDLQNNSSETSFDFYVDDNAKIEIYPVLSYPNPFSDQARFEFNHNKPGIALSIKIAIYDKDGEFIRELNAESNNGTGAIDPVYWDGTNYNGARVPDGLYIYRVEVSDPSGNITIRQQKLMKSTK